jgi:hypothetical protein
MFYKKIIFLLFLSVFLFSQKDDVFAMGSANYKINADVIGVTGGSGSSGSYKLFDTAGEPVIGIGQSLNYKIKAGFAYMTNYSLSLSIDSNTKNLGSVSPGSSVQGQSTLTVTTDSWGGYDVLISENHALLHTDAVTTIADYSCSITSPCVWSGNGFGFTVVSGTNVEAKWGTSPNYNYSAIPLTDTTFHTKTGYTSGADNTVVGYNLAVSGTQRSGTYSNFVTYTAVAKL